MRSIRVRTARATDYPAVLKLNQEAVPAMNEIDIGFLEEFAPRAAAFLVAEGRPEEVGDESPVIGFLLVFPPGVPYNSENYRWFAHRYEDFLYVDRIAVAGTERGRGVGHALYEALIDATGEPPTSGILCCEVNLRPPNPVSLAFHQRQGFRVVGEQDTEGGKKRVALMIREGGPPDGTNA